MKSAEIKQLFEKFESVAIEFDGVECWSARELQPLLGYSKWENFAKVIDKAKEACQNAGEQVDDHFPDARKMLLKRGITPESLPAAEDVKKVQRKLQSEEKKVLKGAKK